MVVQFQFILQELAIREQQVQQVQQGPQDQQDLQEHQEQTLNYL